MGKLPHMPTFVDDFEAATTHLSLEEDGFYNRLLRLCWRTPGCSVPADAKWLMRHLRVDEATFQRVAQPIIDEFWQCQNGRIFQKRQREIYNDVMARIDALSEAGKRGAAVKSRKIKDITPSQALALPEPGLNLVQATKTKTKYKDITPLTGQNDDLFQTENTPQPAKKKATSRPFVSDWVPSQSSIEWAKARGLSDRMIDDLAGACRSHHISKGTLFVDHDQAFQTWVRNDEKFSAQRSAPAPTDSGDAILRRLAARGIGR